MPRVTFGIRWTSMACKTLLVVISYLVEGVSEHVGPKLIMLSGHGYASQLVFKEYAPNILGAVEDADEGNTAMKHIAKCAMQDAKQMKPDNTYATRNFETNC